MSCLGRDQAEAEESPERGEKWEVKDRCGTNWDQDISALQWAGVSEVSNLNIWKLV